MGQCYFVTLKIRTKDECGAVRALRAKIDRSKEERTEYNLDHYKALGIGTDNLSDLLRIFFGGWEGELRPSEDGCGALASDFDTCYGWERVMIEAFEDLAPHLEDGSEIYIDVDEGCDRGVVKQGTCNWIK